MTTADDIRAYAMAHFIRPARRWGKRKVGFSANDIAKGMKLKNRFPHICSSIDSTKFQQLASVRLVGREGPKHSSTVRWKFELITQMPIQETKKPGVFSFFSKKKPQESISEVINDEKIETITGRKKVVLISCVKSKLNVPAKARDLYTSDLFRSALQYAYYLKADKIFVLSAKYGLVELDQVIAPYEMTLNNMGEPQKAWAGAVIRALSKKTDLQSDLFIILAGEKYRKYLLPSIKQYEIPLEGLTFGQQLHELKRKVLP
jgi:hypothetical protein